MVKPTITRLKHHIQKLTLAAVIIDPTINVARQEKYAIRLPDRSLSMPNKYTPNGPPTFKALNPIVGYMSRSHTKSN